MFAPLMAKPQAKGASGSLATASLRSLSAANRNGSATVRQLASTVTGGQIVISGQATGDGGVEGAPDAAPATAGGGGGSAGAAAPASPAAPATWGWGGEAARNIYQDCQVQMLDRAAFLSFMASAPQSSGAAPPSRQSRSKVLDTLGFTYSKITDSKLPEIKVSPEQSGNTTVYRLNPTHAEMAPVMAAAIKDCDFVEGTEKFVVQAGGSCKSGDYPLHWFIDKPGAEKLAAAEREHCADIREAFRQTLATYATGINTVAAANRTYASEKEAVSDATKFIGIEPGRMMLHRYADLAGLTGIRDARNWHTAGHRTVKPDETGCKEFQFMISGNSFPNLGKHPSIEIIRAAPRAPAAGGAAPAKQGASGGVPGAKP